MAKVCTPSHQKRSLSSITMSPATEQELTGKVTVRQQSPLHISRTFKMQFLSLSVSKEVRDAHSLPYWKDGTPGPTIAVI